VTSTTIRDGAPVQLSEQDRLARPDQPSILTAQTFLQPIAAPSILGLYGFAGATFMVAANLAGWFGSPTSPHYLFPFAAFFGGLAQFMAGMWGYKARDGLATAMHGMWGSFWMAYGVLNLLLVTGTLTPPATNGLYVELGYWFIVLAVTTVIGAIMATQVSLSLTGVLTFLAAGSVAMVVACLMGSTFWAMLAGWLFIVSAALAWYTATGLLAEGTFGHSVVPLVKMGHARNAPAYAAGIGEPGVKHGQ
jgi:succinate-acetate transporter protein